MNKLTEKQKKVLGFVQERIYSNMPPTIREIAGHMGFSSTGTVRDYLHALEKKGYLKRANNLSRSIKLVEPLGLKTEAPSRAENNIKLKPEDFCEGLKNTAIRIPIIASIPAGNPNLAYEDVLGYIEPNDLFGGRGMRDNIFALKVKGESMIEAGIMDGDIAVIRRQAVAGNGDIVAALLDNNEVTLKKIRHRNNVTFLEPANKDYQSIHKEFNVIGKLITILRNY